MQTPKVFKGKTSHFVKEGILKALLCGLVFGFVAIFAVSLVGWIKGISLLLIAMIVGVTAFVISSPVFYAICFRPKEQNMAQRLDRTGLEERMITMLQYQNDNSYMAQLQRQDAMEKITVEATKKVPFHVTGFVIACSVFAILAAAMSIVSVLSEKGIIPSGKEWNKLVVESMDGYKNVSYTVKNDDGGMIEGDSEQLVKYGGSATGVLAVEDEGYVFQYWEEDGSTDPYRDDTDIRGDQVWTAVFAPIGDGEDGDGKGGDGEEDDKPQEPQDQPNGGGEGDGDEEEQNPPPSGSNDDDDENDPSDEAGGGFVDHNNYIMDGNTYYRDEFDQEAYDRLMNELANNPNLPADQRALIELYLGIIK